MPWMTATMRTSSRWTRLDPIDKSIAVDEALADLFVATLGHDTPNQWELGKTT